MLRSNQIRKKKGRHNFLGLEVPKPNPDPNLPDRDKWIDGTCQAFVARSKANKIYYRAILECLWPPGHGIPGPVMHANKIREAITESRKRASGNRITAPYLDPFRRLRELQGEEGLVGIARVGANYQLVTLEVAKKRIPRTNLTTRAWELVLERYRGRCAVCGRSADEVLLQQDHKIPRLRYGPYELSNWQPLCEECNNFKSTCCRGCTADCTTCPWAFPEEYAPVRIEPKYMLLLREAASREQVEPTKLLNSILKRYFRK